MSQWKHGVALLHSKYYAHGCESETFWIRKRLAKIDNQTSVSYVRFSCTGTCISVTPNRPLTPALATTGLVPRHFKWREAAGSCCGFWGPCVDRTHQHSHDAAAHYVPSASQRETETQVGFPRDLSSEHVSMSEIQYALAVRSQERQEQQRHVLRAPTKLICSVTSRLQIEWNGVTNDSGGYVNCEATRATCWGHAWGGSQRVEERWGISNDLKLSIMLKKIGSWGGVTELTTRLSDNKSN